MIVVSDTAPLIFFGKVNKLDLLRDLYHTIYLPNEVWDELVYPLTQKYNDIPVDIELEIKAKNSGWLRVKNPEKEESIDLALKLSLELGLGESYAIALSNELNADFLLTNDNKARSVAIGMGIKTKWTTEILKDATSSNLISSFEKFKKILNDMINMAYG